MTNRHLVLLTLAAGLVAGCAGTHTPRDAPHADPSSEGAASPWALTPLAPADVPVEFLEAWESAENRASCALVVPASVGAGQGGVPRVAQFAGGWGVAYDMPELRSAFGVAGTGAEVSGFMYRDFPLEIRWPDGSVAEYGPEGGTGPNELAYLRIAGQGCLYNVWSRLGTDHLEHLLHALRFVDV